MKAAQLLQAEWCTAFQESAFRASVSSFQVKPSLTAISDLPEPPTYEYAVARYDKWHEARVSSVEYFQRRLKEDRVALLQFCRHSSVAIYYPIHMRKE